MEIPEQLERRVQILVAEVNAGSKLMLATVGERVFVGVKAKRNGVTIIKPILEVAVPEYGLLGPEPTVTRDVQN